MDGFNISDFKLLLDMDLRSNYISKDTYDCYMEEINSDENYKTKEFLYGLYRGYLTMYMNI